MRLAVLYSGGKDSTLAMYLAEQAGHDIRCIVSIIPDDDASWLFHTPNLDLIPMMAEAMGVELVTARSSGTEEGDMEGLKRALTGLDVEGVVTGAVWSDYQWDRMNYVCGGMGLKVISPLWRKDQEVMLETILDSGIDAMIVGCYAEGLDESWLGRRIDRSAVDELRVLSDRYGISVMGEGGEYESMTLDSPMHSKRVSVTGYDKQWKKGSGTMRIIGAELTEKEPEEHRGRIFRA